MRKNIDIDNLLLTKLKVISAIEKLSVKALMEQAVATFVQQKENVQLSNLNEEEKLDLGLLLLMQQSNKEELVDRSEIMDLLK